MVMYRLWVLERPDFQLKIRPFILQEGLSFDSPKVIDLILIFYLPNYHPHLFNPLNHRILHCMIDFDGVSVGCVQ